MLARDGVPIHGRRVSLSRPSPGARGLAARGVGLALLAAGLWAVWNSVGRDGVEGPSATTSRGTPDIAPPLDAPPALASIEGDRRRSPGGIEGEGSGRSSGRPQDSAGAPVVAEESIEALIRRLFLGFRGVAPEAFPGRLEPGADAPFPLARSYLVGRVGPYGVRDVTGVGPRTWRGVARLDGSESEAQTDTEDPAETAIRGVVVGDTGEPVAGAEVILYSSFYVRQAFYDHRVRQIGRTFTDALGVFDIRPIALDTVHFGAGGDVLVTVRHAAWADLVAQPLAGIAPGQESDVGRLVLPAQGVVVRGVVRDLEGRPVPDAIVRVSGVLNPVDYDKTERMVVLDECPAAETDAEGRYVLTDFAAGDHEISIHVRIDCVMHVRKAWAGEQEWSPNVPAGNGVRGRVVDPAGQPVAAAVVAGGGNWTPTNADGTFWLDNVQAGPLQLEVAHHAWHTVVLPGVPTDGEDVTIAFARPLARVAFTVVDGAGKPVPIVAIDWAWPTGAGPGRFAPDSRYWHDPAGKFAVIVPEGATGATMSDATGASQTLAAEDLADGTDLRVVLAALEIIARGRSVGPVHPR